MKVRVVVRLKPGIMDVQGAAIMRALVGLGFSELADLRVGKVIELELAGDEKTARRRVAEMCERLLANPVLEDFTIEAIADGELVADGRGGR